MAQLGLWAKIKEWIGGAGFAIYLWSQSLTEEEYFDLLERDAEQRRGADQAQQNGADEICSKCGCAEPFHYSWCEDRENAPF